MKRILTKKTYLKRVRRFSDDELLLANRLGLSDRKIATIFKVTHNVVYRRRKKLGLLAAVRPKLSKEQLINKYKEENRKIYLINKNNPETIELIRQSKIAFMKTGRARKKRSIYMKQYLQKPEVKEKVKKYLSLPKVKERKREIFRKWYKKPENREKDLARKKVDWDNTEEREIMKCNQILSGLLYQRKNLSNAKGN